MATPTYVQIATTTLASPASSVSFFGIPTQDLNGNDLRDLVLVTNTKLSASGGDFAIRLNGDSANYSQVIMRGNGSTAASFPVSTTYLRMSVNDPASGEYHLGVTEILDFSATDKHKPILSRSDNAADSTGAIASRYASTSAISSISVFMQTGTSFDAGSTFSLFGISGVAV